MAEIEPQAIRAHLDRITASRIFADSDRLRRFLRFTVESKLTAQHERVKEYILGREVFDRADDYDPRIDPIVRVEARRLRSKLEEYYNGPGRSEKIRLEYHRGSYLPTFSRPAATLWPSVLTQRTVLLAVAAAAILIGAAVLLLALRRPNPAVVAVVPAGWLEGDRNDLDSSDSGLAEALDAELANRHIARVLAWPVLQDHRNPRKPLLQFASEVDAGKVVLVVVRSEPPSKRVNIFLVDRLSGQKLFAHVYSPRELSSVQSQQALARQIATDLAKPLQS